MLPNPPCSMNQSLKPVKVQLMKDDCKQQEVVKTTLPKLPKVQFLNFTPVSKCISLNLTNSLPVTGQANKQNLRLSQPLLKYSIKTPTSLLKRGRDLSSSIWQRSTWRKLLHENQADSGLLLKNRSQLGGDCQSYSPMTKNNQESEDQMVVDHHWSQTQTMAS